MSDYPKSKVVTGAEFLELCEREKAGELRINGIQVGYSEVVGVDKLGRRKTRHVNSGYTVSLSWRDAPRTGQDGPDLFGGSKDGPAVKTRSGAAPGAPAQGVKMPWE